MSQEMLTSLAIPAVVILIVILRVVFVSSGNRRSGSSAGLAGAAVCRKCGRAFARSFFAPNLIAGKLLRCPHCGAWAILPAASQAEIELAQAREMGSDAAPTGPAPVSEEEAFRRRVEQSKYEKNE